MMERMDFLKYAETIGKQAAADLLLLCGADNYLQGVDNYNDFSLVFKFRKHFNLIVRRKAGKNARSVIIVKKFTAEFKVQLSAELVYAFGNLFRLHR